MEEPGPSRGDEVFDITRILKKLQILPSSVMDIVERIT
jgi:hypothetical protein